MTIEQAMTEASTSRVQLCPGCKQTVDSLRAPAVSVVSGKIVHFCSSSCREKYLQRSLIEKPSSVPSDDMVPVQIESETSSETSVPEPASLLLSPFLQSDLYRSKLLFPQIVQVGIWIVIVPVVSLFPGLLHGRLPAVLAALCIVGMTVWSIVRERRRGLRKNIEAVAIPVSALIVLLGSFFDLSPRRAAAFATALLAAEAMGRLLELIGRHRSGVLTALDAAEPVSIPTSWRDNSAMAAGIRTLAISMEWIRYPLAAAVAPAVYFSTASSMSRALISFAMVVVALNPRTIRMASGDAHLRAALRAAKQKVKVRDADAIFRAAHAKTVLFIAKRTLFQPTLLALDWKPADHINPKTALDALITLESKASGRIAAAICTFAVEKKARAASNVEVTRVAGLGLVGETPWGTVLCGSRSLLLSHGISTGLLESHAVAIESGGRRAVFLAMDGACAAVLAVEERFSEGAEESVQAISRMGLETAMITSSEVVSAQALSNRLGIDTVFFETPEEKLDEVLSHISESGGSVILVGSGAAFEEHFRAADVAFSFGREDAATQAGFDAQDNGIYIVPQLIQIARQAHRSAAVNLVSGIGAALFGAGLAVVWATPLMFLAMGALGFFVSAGCTFNGPYPIVETLRKEPAAVYRRLKKHFL